MKVAVCIKQVPDTAEVRINPDTGTLIREGVPSIINPYDMHALEAALWMKDEHGASVTVLTMGPPQAETALREAISLGADEAILLTDRAFAGADTWATSYALSKAMAKLSPQIILCGKQAIDGDTAQVGPGLGKRLDIPYVSYIRKITSFTSGALTMHRLMDDGYDEVEMPLPGLITVVKEINEPRVPSLKGKMKAKKLSIKTLSADDIGADPASIGLPGSTTQVVKVFAPEFTGERAMLEGSVDEQIEQLVKKLEPYL